MMGEEKTTLSQLHQHSHATIAALAKHLPHPSQSTHPETPYLLGVRGLLTLQSFTFIFLQTFAPTTVRLSANPNGPTYEKALRSSLSVLFWNPTLIYSAFILLSARTIPLPFLHNSTRTTIASTIFRRGLRLWFPTAVALAIVKIVTSTLGTGYIKEFQTHTGNVSFLIPYTLPNTLAYFNSVFNLFWTTANFASQSGNTAFPSQTIWIVNVIYTQSYTAYMTMVIIPYTRASWRVKAYMVFIVTAWWVQSWAWYTVTGLLLADCVINMRYQERAQKGVRIWNTAWRCPTWIPCLILMAAGLAMQYLWTDWRPQYADRELRAHTGLYYSGGLNTQVDDNEPQARDDDYLLLLGFFLLLECSSFLQRVFSNSLFVYLGRRSLSKPNPSCCITRAEHNADDTAHTGWFLVQSIVIYTAGIKLFMHLSIEKKLSIEASRVVCLIVCVTSVILGAELFHRLVDTPSRKLAYLVFDWIRA